MRSEGGYVFLAQRVLQLSVALCLLSGGSLTFAQKSPSVGMAARIDQLVLPGAKLEPKPIVDTKTPIVLRIVSVFPHGTDWRYDIEYFGLEPGEYDLRDFLQRSDGSTTADLPSIPVVIGSLLPQGQIVPNELETGLIPRLGGYRLLVVIAGTLWFVVLLWMILSRRKQAKLTRAPTKEPSLYDYLQPRIQAAIDGRLQQTEFAELERMMFAYWRKRLDYEDVEVAQARERIKQDEVAGPLLTQMERMLHDPTMSASIDLAGLLEPYRELPIDSDFDEVTQPAVATS